jgi:hypothetical protein
MWDELHCLNFEHVGCVTTTWQIFRLRVEETGDVEESSAYIFNEQTRTGNNV